MTMDCEFQGAVLPPDWTSAAGRPPSWKFRTFQGKSRERLREMDWAVDSTCKLSLDYTCLPRHMWASKRRDRGASSSTASPEPPLPCISSESPPSSSLWKCSRHLRRLVRCKLFSVWGDFAEHGDELGNFVTGCGECFVGRLDGL